MKIFNTVTILAQSMTISQSLEAEQWCSTILGLLHTVLEVVMYSMSSVSCVWVPQQTLGFFNVDIDIVLNTQYSDKAPISVL